MSGLELRISFTSCPSPFFLLQAEDEKQVLKGRNQKSNLRSWAANPDLFPCELKPETLAMANKACQVGGLGGSGLRFSGFVG
jgi:hypothetical protein